MKNQNATFNQAQDTKNENPKQKAVVCLCCLTFFPLMYLVGSVVTSIV